MRRQDRPAEYRRPLVGIELAPWARVLLVALLLLGAILYLQHAFQYYMYDDEGGYAYAAWRISQGEVPYRDFLTPQLPVFLYWGGLLVSLCGRSFVALRLATMLATLLTGCLLYATNRELLGEPVGLLSLGFFLVDANVFHNARYFRPEAYMLLAAMAGIYLFVLGEVRARPAYTWLAGVCFGLAILSKLFGFLSLGGCFAYLLYAWWRERRPWRRVLAQALALSTPAAVLAGAAALIFTRASPYFFTAVFEHHAMQGAQLTVVQRLRKALRFYWDYAAGQPLVMVLAACGAWSLLRRGRALPSLFIWQIPTALAFLVLSRQLLARHLTYLSPALATLMAVAVLGLVRGRWPLRVLALLVALAAVYPWLATNVALAAWEEHDTPRLAALVESLTAPGDVVMADYPGINFAAGRRTTYWVAGMSGGAAESGQIQGPMLIAEIEREQPALVIVNTAGGAHQIVAMVGYLEFRRYVQAHYALVDKFQCSYQQLEIYSRRDTMPIGPAIAFDGEVALTGARLEKAALAAGSSLEIASRWQALAPMPHDYSVSLRLVDADGHLWTQTDDELRESFSRVDSRTGQEVGEQLATSHWAPQQIVLQKHRLAIAPTTPPGEYYLIARLYDPSSGLALGPGEGAGHARAGADPIIATLRLEPAAVPANPETLPLAVTLRAPLAEGLELLGAGPLPAGARAGQSVAFDLFWRAPRQPPQDYRLRFCLMQGEEVRQSWPADLVAGYPTSVWREGEVLLAHYDLPLAADLVEGSYTLLVEAIAGGKVAGRASVVADLSVKARPDVDAIAKAIGQPLNDVSFAGRIVLLGYDLSAEELRPGESLSLTLYWRCLEPPAKDYKVFVHLLDQTSQIQGQCDAMPDQGHAPTSGWLPGDLLVDHYEVPLAPSALPGRLVLEVGFYDPVTGQRLPVTRGGQPVGEDRVVLPTMVSVP